MAVRAGCRSNNPYPQTVLPRPLSEELFENPGFCGLIGRVQMLCERCLNPGTSTAQTVVDTQRLLGAIKESEKYGPKAKDLLQQRIWLSGVDVGIEDAATKQRVREERVFVRLSIMGMRSLGRHGKFDEARAVYCKAVSLGLIPPKVIGTYIRTLIAEKDKNPQDPMFQRAVWEEAAEVYRTAEYYVLMNPYIQNLYAEITGQPET